MMIKKPFDPYEIMRPRFKTPRDEVDAHLRYIKNDLAEAIKKINGEMKGNVIPNIKDALFSISEIEKVIGKVGMIK